MSYGCNNNQSVFLKDGRTTSRVTQLPGGASTICLGYGDDTDDRFAGTNNSRKSKNKTKITKYLKLCITLIFEKKIFDKHDK